jgi:capsular polysaccharide biosynthesis protein
MPLSDKDFFAAALSREHVLINPLDLPRLRFDAIRTATDEGVFMENGERIRRFLRSGASFLDDPDEVDLFDANEVGMAVYKSPPSHVVCVNDALLLGYRTIVTTGGSCFIDEAFVEPAQYQARLERLARADDFANEATGLIPTGTARRFMLQPRSRQMRHVAGTAVFIGSDEPLSYGSFLFRVLPKVRTMRQTGLIGETCIAVAQQKPHRDLLGLAGVPDTTIMLHDSGVLTRVDRLLVPSLNNPHGFIDPESRAFFAELSSTSDGRGRGRRIYVSRLGHNAAGWSTRVMVNEIELIARLEGMAFDIVEPERLDVRDQIATFAAADLVVGPAGSGMYNTLFCRPGAKVIDLQSEKQWIYSYAGMYASLGLDYGIFVGRSDPMDKGQVHRRWTVNIDALVTRIEKFTKG